MQPDPQHGFEFLWIPAVRRQFCEKFRLAFAAKTQATPVKLRQFFEPTRDHRLLFRAQAAGPVA